MQRDTLVFDIINQELARQRRGIELIASENFTSLQVLQATGCVMTINMQKDILEKGIMVDVKL